MKLHPSQNFLLLISAFGFGLVVAYYDSSFFIQSFYFYAGMIFFYLIIPKKWTSFFLLLLAFFFGGKYYLASWDYSLESFYDEYIETQGQIVLEVDKRQDHQKITVKLKEIKLNEDVFLVKTKILVKVPLYPQYSYGDELKIRGKLRQAGQIEDFDYGEYLARYEIYGVMYNASIEMVENDPPNPLFALIFRFKHYALSLINKLLPEPHASFLAGVLLGDRKGIPEELMTAFNRTGVTHIIAVSGYNITLVATALMSLAFGIGLWRRQAIVFAIIGILLFMVLTGASAAVVRAAVMGIVVLLAKYWGRQTAVFNVLALTVFIMLLFNPKILLLDVGFQLSFLATVGLIYLSKPLEKVFGFLPERFSFKESFTTTLAAIILTSPLIFYVFKRFSLVALLVNLLILPAIPLAMALGALMFLGAIIYFPLGQFLAYLTWLSLEYIIIMVDWGSRWSYAVWQVNDFSQVAMLVSYFGIFLLLFKYYKKEEIKKKK